MSKIERKTIVILSALEMISKNRIDQSIIQAINKVAVQYRSEVTPKQSQAIQTTVAYIKEYLAGLVMDANELKLLTFAFAVDYSEKCVGNRKIVWKNLHDLCLKELNDKKIDHERIYGVFSQINMLAEAV